MLLSALSVSATYDTVPWRTVIGDLLAPWLRVSQAGVIDYSGDLLTPPDAAARKSHVTQKKKTIRGRDDSDSDSD